MRVLFIYPTVDCPPGISHGLAAMAGVLRSRGHEAELLHLCEGLGPVPSIPEVVAEVARRGPDLVGFSVMTQQWPWVQECSRALRTALPELPQAAGGVHCTMVPDDVNATGLFEWTFVGEADWSFAELVDRLARGEETSTVPGTRAGDHSTPVPPFPQLEELPPKDYELFDLDRITAAKAGWLGLLTSRGCPYRCTYCFNHQIVDRYRSEGALPHARDYLRRYEPERIVGEIRTLVARHPGISTLILDDDLFTLDRKYVLTFCEAYRTSGISLPFVVNGHVQCFDAEIAGALAAAGCRICKFGIESGSEDVRRRVLARHTPTAAIEAAIRTAHAAGLHTSVFVMFGLPRETRAQIEQTVELCARLEVGRFRWALFFPFPGTEAHRLAEADGLIDHERMARLGNYFDATCLRFGAEHDLFVDKLTRCFAIWVNAATSWPAAGRYRELAAEIDALDRPAWETRAGKLLERADALSEELLAGNVLHYTVRYSSVMGVRSDYVLAEAQQG